jgi:hypothetical protein
LDETNQEMDKELVNCGADSSHAALIERNWPIVDSLTGEVIRPALGEAVEVEGKKAFRPRDNYLVVTRIPNFLDPHFTALIEKDWTSWPWLLIFSGTHGPATKAVELLIEDVGLDVLESINKKLRSARAFQVLCRVGRLERDSWGTHKFRRIELCDVHRLNMTKKYTKRHTITRLEDCCPSRDRTASSRRIQRMCRSCIYKFSLCWRVKPSSSERLKRQRNPVVLGFDVIFPLVANTSRVAESS